MPLLNIPLPFLLLQAYLVIVFVVAVSEEEGNNGVVEEEDEALRPWLEALSELGPYLAVIFIDLFLVHLLVFSDFATRQLMLQYRREAMRIPGQALSSQLYGQRILVEVMYEADEHKYADNPSLKFRNPDAYERKRFLRTFEFHQEVDRGSHVEILLPPGGNHTRSGIPTVVVDRTLEAFSPVKVGSIVAIAAIVLLVFEGLCLQRVLAMENPSTGGFVLVAFIGLSEAIIFLYNADRFLKSKRRRFDSAMPMVNTEEQRLAQQQQHQAAKNNRKPEDPFRIPLHEFAGHARASERERFD